jgi:hypothetical protein
VNRTAFSRFVAASLLPIAFVSVSFAQSDLLSTLRVRVEQECRI